MSIAIGNITNIADKVDFKKNGQKEIKHQGP